MTGEAPLDAGGDQKQAANPAVDVTVLLQRVAEGALPQTQLFEMVHAQLCDLSRGQMSREQVGHTLQPTVLVHEAWMRLGGNEAVDWKSRAHFFGAAGEAVLQMDDALTSLEQHDERLARIVRLRFWAGLDEQQVATMLDLSTRTVRRDWKLALAWLTRELEG